jgi:hypothetical protein
MKINEVLASVAPYTWTDDSVANKYSEAEFEINGKEYMVLFSPTTDDLASYDIEFGKRPEQGSSDPYTQYHITGTGDAYLIMGTIQAICQEWFANHSVNHITMSADVPSRRKLYVRMLSNLLPNWQFTLIGDAISVSNKESAI